MDIHQLEYIIAIEQEQSVSRAAERLFLTQSALNQQLLRLENELGTPLFERRSRMMIPTLAGRIYLAAAHRMVDMKRETYKIIRDIAEETAGEIALAYTPEVGARMFTAIYPIFHKKYPDVTFRIYEQRVKSMERLLLQKAVTFACTTYYKFSRLPELDYLDMDSEYMVLALPAGHPLAARAGEKSWEALPLLDLKLLQNENFVMSSRDTLMRDMVDYCFAQAGFSPRILFESSSTHTIVSMVEAQIAPAFIPQSYVRPGDTAIVYFTVPPRLRWSRSIATLKGAYLTKPEKYFIALATDYVRGMLRESMGLPRED